MFDIISMKIISMKIYFILYQYKHTPAPQIKAPLHYCIVHNILPGKWTHPYAENYLDVEK